MRKEIMLFMTVLLMMFMSCTKTVIIYEDDFHAKDIVYISKQAYQFDLVNEAKNINLTIYSCDINGIEGDENHLSDTLFLRYGERCQLNAVQIGFQDIKDAEIIINGKIEMNDIVLYEGIIYIPLYKIIENDSTKVVLRLYGGCPWYVELDGEFVKVLQPIHINVEVEDWNETEIEIIV